MVTIISTWICGTTGIQWEWGGIWFSGFSHCNSDDKMPSPDTLFGDSEVYKRLWLSCNLASQTPTMPTTGTCEIINTFDTSIYMAVRGGSILLGGPVIGARLLGSPVVNEVSSHAFLSHFIRLNSISSGSIVTLAKSAYSGCAAQITRGVCMRVLEV